MDLLLIRHAQSVNNLLLLNTGSRAGRQADPPLSDLGREQAALLGQAAPTDAALRGITHLYCSLTTRAVQTAAPLAAALGLPVQGLADAHETGGLHEGWGDEVRVPVQGKDHASLLSECPALLWPAHLTGQAWDGGFEARDYAAYAARARRVISHLRAAHGQGDRVALVTHQHFGHFLLSDLLGLPGPDPARAAFQLDNTAHTQLYVTAGGCVVAWMNGAPHLPPDLRTN